MNDRRAPRSRRWHPAGIGLSLIAVCPLLLVLSTPAYAAAGDLTSVIDGLRLWAAGLLAALATLFLTLGGVRYLMANGDPRALEEGKAAIRSALIGYGLAALAPLFMDVLRRVLGT